MLPDGPYKLFALDLNGNLYSAFGSTKWTEGLTVTSDKGIEIAADINEILEDASRVIFREINGIDEKLVTVVGTVAISKGSNIKINKTGSLVVNKVTLKKLYCCPAVKESAAFSQSFKKFKNPNNV